MSSTRKPRGDAVLKNLPDALQDELYQMLRRNTQEKVVEWLKADHGIKTDSGALSRFWEWYHSWSLKPAADFAGSLQKQFEKMPQLKGQAEKIREITQVAFEMKAAQDRDPKLFFALGKARHDARRLALEENKFRESIKTDIEKGLDALHSEIKDNTEALTLFERLKAAVMKSVGGSQ